MKSRSRNIMIAVFTIPAMIAIALVFVYPVVRTILMSFFAIDNVVSKMSEWSFVGVSNYTQLLGTPLFRQTWVTFAKIWVFGGLVIMCIAMLFAVILTSGVRGKSFWRAAIYLPNIISAVALANMWIHATLSRTFEEAADFMHMSPAYFSRYFKKMTGLTFSSYLNVLRVDRAVELLAGGEDITMADLMARCGFNTLRNFNRVFKAVTGYAPTSLPAGFSLDRRVLLSQGSTFDPTLDTSVVL